MFLSESRTTICHSSMFLAGIQNHNLSFQHVSSWNPEPQFVIPACFYLESRTTFIIPICDSRESGNPYKYSNLWLMLYSFNLSKNRLGDRQLADKHFQFSIINSQLSINYSHPYNPSNLWLKFYSFNSRQLADKSL